MKENKKGKNRRLSRGQVANCNDNATICKTAHPQKQKNQRLTSKTALSTASPHLISLLILSLSSIASLCSVVDHGARKACVDCCGCCAGVDDWCSCLDAPSFAATARQPAASRRAAPTAPTAPTAPRKEQKKRDRFRIRGSRSQQRWLELAQHRSPEHLEGAGLHAQHV